MMLLFWLANTIFWMSKKIQILGIEFLILIFFIFPFEDFFRRGMILRRDTFFGSRVEVPSRIYVFSLAAQSIDLEKYIDIQVFGEFHSIPLGIHEILYACYFTPLIYWLLRRPAYCWGDVERVMGSMLFVDSGTKRYMFMKIGGAFGFLFWLLYRWVSRDGPLGHFLLCSWWICFLWS